MSERLQTTTTVHRLDRWLPLATALTYNRVKRSNKRINRFNRDLERRLRLQVLCKEKELPSVFLTDIGICAEDGHDSGLTSIWNILISCDIPREKKTYHVLKNCYLD